MKKSRFSKNHFSALPIDFWFFSSKKTRIRLNLASKVTNFREIDYKMLKKFDWKFKKMYFSYMFLTSKNDTRAIKKLLKWPKPPPSGGFFGGQFLTCPIWKNAILQFFDKINDIYEKTWYFKFQINANSYTSMQI